MASFYLVTFLLLALTSISKADLTDEICSKSTNPSSCNETLRSDPRFAGLDLRGLGRIVVDKARGATQQTLQVAKSLSQGEIKEKAKSCIENCGDAIENLKECRSLLKARDRFSISTLQTRGSAALSDVDTCDDEFGEGAPANLKDATSKTKDLIDVLLVIANSL